MTNINNKVITEKDTKAVIFGRYKEILKELEAYKDSNFSPDEIKKEKGIQSIISRANKCKESLSDLNDDNKSLIETIEKSVEEYDNLKEAITLKRSELDDLTGFENEVFNLAAIIKTIDQTNIDHKNDIKTLELELKEKKRLLDLERSREMEQYEFDLRIKKRDDKKKALDEISYMKEKAIVEIKLESDIIANQLQQIETDKSIIAAKEAELNLREDTLSNEIADIKKKAAAEKSIAISSLESKLNNDHKFAIIEKDSTIDSLKQELAFVKNINAELKVSVEDISNKLDQAYERNQETVTAIASSMNQSSSPSKEAK